MQHTGNRMQFAARLREICDDMGVPERGRQTELGRLFNVSPKAARKWLVGDGFPEIHMAISIARWADVSFDWLMTGVGIKKPGLTSTKHIVLNEAIDSMPIDDRQQVLDFILYKIERNDALFRGDRLTRYLTMIDAFKKDRESKR